MSKALTDEQVADNKVTIDAAETLEDLKALEAVKNDPKIKPLLAAKIAKIKAAEKKESDKKNEEATAKGGEYLLLCAIADQGERGEIKKLSASDAKRYGGKMVRKATKEDKAALKKAKDGADVDEEE